MSVALISTAGERSMSLLRSRTFWVIVLLIIIGIIIWRNLDKFITKADSRLGQQTGDWQEGTITAGRKATLEALARELYKSIYTLGGAPAYHMSQASALNDNELLYLARYYEKETGAQNSLYFDTDEEWMAGTSIDEDLMARLADLGMK